METMVKPICIGNHCLTEETSRKCINVLHAAHPVILSVVFISSAIYTYYLFARYDAIPVAMTALAGASAFICLEMALEGTTPVRRILNLLAAPITFALALASMTHGVSYLVGAFAFQALIAANQTSVAEGTNKNFFLGWASFNATLALLLF